MQSIIVKAAKTLFILPVVTLLFAGCSTSSRSNIVSSYSRAAGNWQFTSSSATAARLPALTGDLTVSGTQLSGTFHPLVAPTLCIPVNTLIHVTGAITEPTSTSSRMSLSAPLSWRNSHHRRHSRPQSAFSPQPLLLRHRRRLRLPRPKPRHRPGPAESRTLPPRLPLTRHWPAISAHQRHLHRKLLRLRRRHPLAHRQPVAKLAGRLRRQLPHRRQRHLPQQSLPQPPRRHRLRRYRQHRLHHLH